MGFDPLPDTILLCDGPSPAFDATFLTATYSWSTGSIAPAEAADRPGLLTVAADMGSCILNLIFMEIRSITRD